MFLPILLLIIVDILTIGAEAINDHDDEYNKKLADFGLGKRAAYSYVSEYKRLPVYNFGLGKRTRENGKQYSFGLGKRDYENNDDIEYVDDDFATKEELAKRTAKLYSFGLGKRPSMKLQEGKMYAFGLGKRFPLSDSSYNLDDGNTSEESKRSSQNGHRFSFGLGKRAEQDQLGGKRTSERSMHYSFGLGKRQLDSSDNIRN
ncbi:hypothetical protein O3M35_004465 [Rhynocoris fuscipes]|uniref:Allatostatins n=1 Tax=Rhynocoris fuscipes TaxID=488301 RepID=A0AAW1CJZ4_9HEMI